MRTQVKTYTFTAGTRQITVTDDITFAKADIAIIVNRTQQKVLFTIPDYNLITDVTNKVITYDNSLPVLAENDVLWIEIDIEVTATKIIREDPIVTEVNGEYHPNDYNLVYELAQHIPNDYPHCYIVKFAKDSETTALNGADAYYTSDDSFYEANVTHTWNDWNNGKITRYVIYCFVNREVNILFSTLGVTNVLELMTDDVTIGTITMSSAIINKFWGTDKTIMTSINASAFKSSKIAYFDIPTLQYIGSYAFYGCANLSSINLSNVNIINEYALQSCTSLYSTDLSNCTEIYRSAFRSAALKRVILPSIISFPGASVNIDVTGLEYLYLGNQLTSFPSAVLYSNKGNLTKIEVQSGYDCTSDFRLATVLTTANIYDYIIPNLKDNTGFTAKTITFATAVYNALNAAGYIALFTAKNWNVASA